MDLVDPMWHVPMDRQPRTSPSHKNCVGTEGMGGYEDLEGTEKGISRDIGTGEQRTWAVPVLQSP